MTANTDRYGNPIMAIAPDGQVVQLMTTPSSHLDVCLLCYCNEMCRGAGGMSYFTNVIGTSCNELDGGVWRKVNEET